MITHRLPESLARGEKIGDEPFWNYAFRAAFTGFVGSRRNICSPADRPNAGQRRGVDRWVSLSSGKTLTIQEKRREKDFGDTLLEYAHVGGSGRRWPGWMGEDHAVDYLAVGYFDTMRCNIFPWDPMRTAWSAQRREWLRLAFTGLRDDLKTVTEAERAFIAGSAPSHRGAHGFSAVKAHNSSRRGDYWTLSICVPTSVIRSAVTNVLTIDVVC